MSKHTPGPWTWYYGHAWKHQVPTDTGFTVEHVRHDTEVDWDKGYSCGIYLAGPPVVSIGSMFSPPRKRPDFVLTLDEMDENNAKANARLITAAPELLAACKDALKKMNEIYDAQIDMTMTVGAEIDQLESVIAKATKK